MGLDARLRTAKLYLCTDARREQGDFGDFVDAAFAGGVDVLQVRDKNLEPDEELDALELARTIAYHYNGLVVVNDSPVQAKKFNADVLHLGQDDDKPKMARKFLHQWALIGSSTHSEKQAKRALDDPDVNYFCVGPVYATPTKPDYRPVGLDLVEYAATIAKPGDPKGKPWFAIGGINADNLDDVLAAGARRIVVVRAITESDDPEGAARRLADRIAEQWQRDPAMQLYLDATFRQVEESPFVDQDDV